MLIRFTQQPPWTVAELLVHRLDEVNAGAVQEAFAPVLHHPHGDLVVELSRLDFVDKTGLATLQTLLQHLSTEGRLHLAGHGPLLQRLRELHRLPPNAEVFPTLSDALH
ncbi:STAS domain-containing protein [Crenobacter sp. SG2303]|uniref:STAS domain-containing protein n=1 Tax=Crenobacter oryzisoli TaxID=3056844 RepID=A0ABT7XJK9_9NEIS|nr:STAS domain-containing protein [Crenobacter sp. SG2303]MDN0073971.1 STAS domain-containing protein [Crenobacter sp. SG2303]